MGVATSEALLFSGALLSASAATVNLGATTSRSVHTRGVAALPWQIELLHNALTNSRISASSRLRILSIVIEVVLPLILNVQL